MKNNSKKPIVPFLLFFFIFSYFLPAFSQQSSYEELVKYERQSNFIKEFKIPVSEIGLKGITTDTDGNAWFYHSTNNTSTIFKLDPKNGKFDRFDIEGKTVADSPIINLAGGLLVFDKNRSFVWFTDSRTNSIGKLDTQNGKVDLIPIPTEKSGPMGITLSPDGKYVWFSEIIANKISRLNVESNEIVEYSTGEQSGPTFLTFDKAGKLWATLTYSNSILRVTTDALDNDISNALYTIKLPAMFSPFGIVVIDSDGKQKIFFSDHGSSRIISVDSSSDFQSYTTFWTSPSYVYPVTLPGQLVVDNSGNIYFPQHGGNRISKLNLESNIITEYDIPTGPLSTVVFIAASHDDTKIWFTEVAANKVAYLDTTINIPFNLYVESDNKLTLVDNEQKTIDVLLKTNENNSSLVSLSEVELGITGMTESGLEGILYNAQPQRVDLIQNKTIESKINLSLDEKAKAGDYNIMVRAIIAENDQLLVSQLYPISITLDIPTTLKEAQLDLHDDKKIESNNQLLHDSIRMVALVVAIGLIGFLIYNRAKKKKTS